MLYLCGAIRDNNYSPQGLIPFDTSLTGLYDQLCLPQEDFYSLNKKRNIMNSNVTNSIIDMENDDLRNLVNQVKETVATDVDTKKTTSKNTFAAANLWSIQKMKRGAQARRATLWN
jgi:hypothetical protein